MILANQIIRLGRLQDLPEIQNIERSAGLIFADFGMASIAEDEPPSIETLSQYCMDERLWVTTNKADEPVAYLIADLVDGCAHIEQISVHAKHAGKGLGRALIGELAGWALERDLSAITLTTFAELPWNAPYYERLGFKVIPEEDYSEGLRHIRQGEREHGLDEWPRVCMIRAV